MDPRTQAFDRRGIDLLVRQSDYRKYRNVLSAGTRDVLVDDAVQCAAANFNGKCGLHYKQKGRRLICMADDFPTMLVLRKLAANIHSLTKTPVGERDSLVKVLLLFLSEEISYRIYRLDLRRFYDSLSRDQAIRRLSAEAVSRKTVELLDLVLAEHSISHEGIPTGLPISASLAEVMMAPFDDHVRTLTNVFYFGRFVDDMIIITSGSEDPAAFESELSSFLPKGACFGTTKRCCIDVPPVGRGTAPILGRFEFLGYAFSIRDKAMSKRKWRREIDVNLSEDSYKRTLTRLAKAFRTYSRDGRFDDLYCRVRYLTSNYRLFDPVVGRRRLAGIFHSHQQLTYHCGNSLQKLDVTLRKFIFGFPACRATQGITLNSTQKQMLSARSFVRGHERKEYYHFAINTLARIKRCWKNG